MPLDPPLRYNLFLECEAYTDYTGPEEITGSATLRERQSLASTNLTTNKWDTIACFISIEAKASPPLKNKPSSTPSSLGETIITALTSREVTAIANFITIATGLITFIGVLSFVTKQWTKKHDIDSTSLQERTSQPSETDVVSVHLRMTHGDDQEFEEWLTDPDRLKHYIDVFNQPSSSIQPLQAIFVQRNGKVIKVDVSEGAQNNRQLNEVLSYLNIASEEK